MATKKVNTRVMNKCDLDENWRLATNFTPKKGELIIYQNCAEPASSTNYVTGNTKFKIGDGTTKVGDLPFQADDANSYEVITLTSASGTLTQEVYNKIISSPFNKIKYLNKIYILQEENSRDYVYTSNYLTSGSRITIVKSTRAISRGSLDAIASHYTAYNYIGAEDTQANGATTNGNTYLKLYENGAKRSQFNIKGTNGIEVSSDNNGNVTINGTTNGFYPYKGVVYNNPTVGTTYSYHDDKTDYSNTDCSYRQGQMIVDQNGVIYKVTATTMCECVYIPSTAISTEDINAICSQVILNSEDVDL